MCRDYDSQCFLHWMGGMQNATWFGSFFVLVPSEQNGPQPIAVHLPFTFILTPKNPFSPPPVQLQGTSNSTQRGMTISSGLGPGKSFVARCSPRKGGSGAVHAIDSSNRIPVEETKFFATSGPSG